jgi:hypothetical protein
MPLAVIRIAALVAFLFAIPAAARADAVLDWNAIAVGATGGNPFTQARFMAITQLAVFEAVNAITGEYEPYLGTISAPAGASADTAAISAAYEVLKFYFPANATLDAARANSLAAIPAGTAREDGIAVGQAAAAAIVNARAADGALPAPAGIESAGPVAPGVWQRTPTCPPGGGIFALWSNVMPFGIESAIDFLLPPPPDLTSNRYAKDFNEVKQVGMNSTPHERGDVATFYANSSPSFLFNSTARQLAAARGDSLTENARSLALMNMAVTDALVASFLNKYYYDFWRPETAIPMAAIDGNDKTATGSFQPYIATPCFPSYPSNHASGSSAAAEVLRRVYGAAGHSIVLQNPAVPGVVFRYSQLKQITDDVDDARVYGGIHFRFDQEEGARLGRAVATEIYKNNLRAVHP